MGMEDRFSEDAVMPVLKKITTTGLYQEGGRILKGGDPPHYGVAAAKSEDQSAFVNVTLWMKMEEGVWPAPGESAAAFSRFSAVWGLLKSDEDFEALVEDLRRGPGIRLDRHFEGAKAIFLKEGDCFTLRLDRLAHR